MKSRKIAMVLMAMTILLTLFTLAACGDKKDGGNTVTSETEVTNQPESTDDASAEPSEPQAVDIELPDIIKDGKASEIKVYDISSKSIVDLTVQEYLYGVVAGEVGNDWPEEVLKAQAVIARTFMLNYFVTDEKSKYEGADISTDVGESQAYNKEDINEAIQKAVDDTTGMVIAYKGEPITAFFHSCSGGKTATAVEGLEHKEDLPYLQPVESDDSSAPEDVKEWSGEFSKEKLLAALASMEEDIGDFDSVEISEEGPSGRALKLKFGDAEVSCPQLRMAISASEFRSTLITELRYENDILYIKGKGFGHGVGMPQWDAKQMSEDGASYEEIIKKYFQDVDVVIAWE